MASATIERFLRDESGTTSIEYSMIAMLMAVACIAAFKNLGGNVGNTWAKIAGNMS